MGNEGFAHPSARLRWSKIKTSHLITIILAVTHMIYTWVHTRMDAETRLISCHSSQLSIPFLSFPPPLHPCLGNEPTACPVCYRPGTGCPPASSRSRGQRNRRSVGPGVETLTDDPYKYHIVLPNQISLLRSPFYPPASWVIMVIHVAHPTPLCTFCEALCLDERDPSWAAPGKSWMLASIGTCFVNQKYGTIVLLCVKSSCLVPDKPQVDKHEPSFQFCTMWGFCLPCLPGQI